jgi:hypothetical protein
MRQVYADQYTLVSSTIPQQKGGQRNFEVKKGRPPLQRSIALRFGFQGKITSSPSTTELSFAVALFAPDGVALRLK